MSAGSKQERRPKGEGTYQTRKSDGWVRLVVRKGTKQLTGPYQPTKTKAREEWNRKHQQNAKPSVRGQSSLSTRVREWRKGLKGSPATLAQWDLFIRNKLGVDLDEEKEKRPPSQRDPIGDLKPGQIDDSVVRAWLLRQKGAKSTIRRNLGRLKQVLRDVGVKVDVPRPPDPGHERRPLTPRERLDVAKVLAQADEPTRRAILLAYYAGLNRSEICALQHSDRDGDGIRIRRRAIQTKGELHIQPETKTSKRKGWIPVPDELSFVGPPRTGYVLTDSKEPLTPVALTHRLKDAMKGTALENIKYAGLHIFRRTYGMVLLEKGVDVTTAAELMRHDPVMLLKEYTRSREDLKRDAIKKAFGPSDSEANEPPLSMGGMK
jgi:integrase